MAEPTPISKTKEVKPRPRAPSALWVRYYKSLFIFSVLVIAVVGWFLLIGPKYAEMSAMDVGAKQAELNAYNATLQKFQKAVSDWQAAPSESRAKLDYFLPTGEDAPGLVALLDVMARTSGFAVTQISFSHLEQPIEPASEVYPILISMSVEGGGYAELKKFIDKIESDLRLMDVDTLTFQSGKGSYVFNIVAYFLKK
ncbi:MAG: hypothetical protein PHW53_03145 [Patescibacteria group bacterium]|nr:hypothetical protein [Patescibacteria group bacterium]